MTDSHLSKKLLIKSGMHIAVFNAPAGYLENLAPLPEGVEVAGGTADMLDFVQLFVRDSAEYDRLGPAALRAVKPDGLLWICYPKRSAGIASDLDRDAVWQMLEPTGLRPVAQIAIDEVWSALRFRPTDKVKPREAK